MSTPEENGLRICPICESSNAVAEIAKRDYRCAHCGFEMAHLDVAPNGVIRGVLGWLCAAGDTIEERYRVKSVLGRGGFGATYLVEDLRLNGKRRALKEVPELLFDEYETALLSHLNHPAIPDILDRAVHDGMVYLILEYGGDRTLGGESKRFEGGRIPWIRLLPWMRQLCEVLTYLHSQQPPIIHRDLKPDNILLDENGRIMLIDFGIAKEARPATLTRTLGRAATHGFSPPEQAMGTGTDERSDIYALAATCYALLTGKSPPAAHERVAGTELIPPSQIVPDIPPTLDAGLLRALELNINHRQQSIQEFSRTLDELDLVAAERSSRTAELSGRTVKLDQMPTGGTTKPPTSIKIPSVEIPTGKSAPATGVPGLAPNKRTFWLTASFLAFALIAAAVAVSVYLKEPQKTETPVPLLPQPPVASFTAEPSHGTAPLEVTFDGSASSDPDGMITEYSWEFGDGMSGSGIRPQHTYREAGSYVAKLNVTDNVGTHSAATLQILVTTASATPSGGGSRPEPVESAGDVIEEHFRGGKQEPIEEKPEPVDQGSKAKAPVTPLVKRQSTPQQRPPRKPQPIASAQKRVPTKSQIAATPERKQNPQRLKETPTNPNAWLEDIKPVQRK